MKAVVVVPIRGAANHWKVAEPHDPPASVQDRVVNLEIRGNAWDGFHLVMSPAGCFTADSWHDTVQEAKDAASRVFGVFPDGWT